MQNIVFRSASSYSVEEAITLCLANFIREHKQKSDVFLNYKVYKIIKDNVLFTDEHNSFNSLLLDKEPSDVNMPCTITLQFSLEN